MKQFFKILKKIFFPEKDDLFLKLVESIEVTVSKILSLALIGVIIFAVFDVVVFIYQRLVFTSNPLFKDTLFEIFGLFLNILIALEILENVTAYLRKHTFQVELVIATSLIAVARKIIIFDIDKKPGEDLIGLGFAIIALSISFWIIRSQKNRPSNH
ncbi:MAG: phosphate-starvation-inducible PsiE family protein [Okeania sp. SIO3B5]|uniref:phosphate-starvation-inducible PsiE family protein n=1 Tax=Okeania sp. SIO3B5 TaxID=2607811 RepID=UPI001400BA5D|nr:phosphate-starvation-inducible PsiE family protein [Okeania sp. SIO3B5]NEO57889.1 phosphate-starvation-inducible PsiE family protein [Okeania sp. SIO3B5]